MKHVIVSRARWEALLEIERQAQWVEKGRSISRQAALNCVPDLIKAVQAAREAS